MLKSFTGRRFGFVAVSEGGREGLPILGDFGYAISPFYCLTMSIIVLNMTD